MLDVCVCEAWEELALPIVAARALRDAARMPMQVGMWKWLLRHEEAAAQEASLLGEVLMVDAGAPTKEGHDRIAMIALKRKVA